MPSPQFSDAEVLEIRFQHSRNRLDVRVWADTKLCSIETIRRIARGDTYRHVAGLKQHPTYGGLHAASPASGQRPAAGHPLASFVPPEATGLADLPNLALEPDTDEAEASLARLQASLAMPVPGDLQASAAASLLDELQGKAEGPGKPPTELG